jgi:hypothetical protein
MCQFLYGLILLLRKLTWECISEISYTNPAHEGHNEITKCPN